MIRIHVLNDASGEPALHFNPDLLESALASRQLTGAFDVSYGQFVHGERADANHAEVLLLAGVPQQYANADNLRWLQSTFAGVDGFLRGLPANVMHNECERGASQQGR